MSARNKIIVSRKAVSQELLMLSIAENVEVVTAILKQRLAQNETINRRHASSCLKRLQEPCVLELHIYYERSEISNPIRLCPTDKNHCPTLSQYIFRP